MFIVVCCPGVWIIAGMPAAALGSLSAVVLCTSTFVLATFTRGGLLPRMRQQQQWARSWARSWADDCSLHSEMYSGSGLGD
jgi:hypothetical protein